MAASASVSVIVSVSVKVTPNEQEMASYGIVSPRIQKEDRGEPEHEFERIEKSMSLLIILNVCLNKSAIRKYKSGNSGN